MSWEIETYHARIQSTGTKRYAGGSPDPEELNSYLEACRDVDFHKPAVVLGMTPELRNLALDHFDRLISIDSSPIAIDLLRDWVSPAKRKKETIIQGSWQDLGNHLPEPCSAIFGDGIIGNLSNFETSAGILANIRNALTPDGVCVMRNIIIPEGFDCDRFPFGELLNSFRSGKISEAEFGFVARIFGFHRLAYDSMSETLHCGKVYQEIERLKKSGALTELESEILSRYHFAGDNYFPRQATWEKLLQSVGFSRPVTHRSCNTLWSEFYQVQSFHPV